jgi:hypothetical protein
MGQAAPAFASGSRVHSTAICVERRLERAQAGSSPPPLPDCRMRRSASSTTSNRRPVAYPAGGVQRATPTGFLLVVNLDLLGRDQSVPALRPRQAAPHRDGGRRSQRWTCHSFFGQEKSRKRRIRRIREKKHHEKSKSHKPNRRSTSNSNG